MYICNDRGLLLLQYSSCQTEIRVFLEVLFFGLLSIQYNWPVLPRSAVHYQTFSPLPVNLSLLFCFTLRCTEYHSLNRFCIIKSIFPSWWLFHQFLKEYMSIFNKALYCNTPGFVGNSVSSATWLIQTISCAKRPHKTTCSHI